jgi:hypothetical protein
MPHHWPPLLVALVTAITPLHGAIAGEARGLGGSNEPTPKPVKVFILAGQSNMQGQAVVDLSGPDYNGGKGTLEALLNDPAKSSLVAHLKSAAGGWSVRRDVWVRYQPEGGPLMAGPLTVGFTPYADAHHFGPELQFGHVVGDAIENEVLLIKTAWGGKSLYTDFRPPSAEGETGPYYTMMIEQVRRGMANFKEEFPGSTASGCELAGFVWYHGWNDGCDPERAVPAYEQNLVHLIQDVRRDLGAPDMPVVIGELTGPWVTAEGEWALVRQAQAAAATNPGVGNAVFVPTHTFVRAPEESPNPGHGHHEFGNAETYFLVGDALGRAMTKLLAKAPVAQPEAGAPEPARPAGVPLGLDGVVGAAEVGEKLIRVTGIRHGSAEAGLLRVGDVLLGVHARRFKADPLNEFTEAVSRARRDDAEHNIRLVLRREGVERTLDFDVFPPHPDFTRGGDTTGSHEWNLGPTGAKGWIHTRGFDTSHARQILVSSVEPGSPADGVLSPGDVITGVHGEVFDGDARVALGKAITEAERDEHNGKLSLLRWRAGEQREVTVPLSVLGGYSDTSPYDCPKARRIVEDGCRAILKRGLAVNPHSLRVEDWSPEIPTTVNALALLASGDPAYLGAVREYAHTIAPPGLSLPLQAGMYSWSWSYANVFAAEYYLATGDQTVLPAIREYSRKIALGQSMVGTWGHGFRVPGNNGTLGGYGAVNQAGLICWMSLALAQRCGINDPEVDRAVSLSRSFFSFYIGKGSIPYGDHPPYWLHDDNGKSAAAAIIFDVLGDQRGASFFSRMATAAYGEKELGHTGNYFGLLWGALGANRAGPDAAAAFLAEQRWYLDLARRWDGSFFTTERDNYGWDMTGLFVLHAAMPMRTLIITGKGVSDTDSLTGDELGKVIASGRSFSLGRFDDACALQRTDELLRDLADWSPTRRERAARALAEREEAEVLPTLVAMLDAVDLNARYGACLALQYMEERAAPATDALVRQLAEGDMWLRTRAAFALASIGKPALRAVPKLLELCTAVDPADPRGLQGKYISFALFRADFVDQIPRKRGLLADSLAGVDRTMVYPAIRRMLACDDGLGTMSVRSIFRTMSEDELRSILPDIIGTANRTAPSGEMFAQEIRVDALRFLAAHKVAVGLPVFIEYASTQNGWGSRTTEILPLLKNYGADAAPVLPALRELHAAWKAKEEADEASGGVTRSAVAAEVIAAIEASVAAPGAKR